MTARRYRDIGRPSPGNPAISGASSAAGGSHPLGGPPTTGSSHSTYNRKRAKEKLYLDFQVSFVTPWSWPLEVRRHR